MRGAADDLQVPSKEQCGCPYNRQADRRPPAPLRINSGERD
jgi:hypothetical protein